MNITDSKNIFFNISHLLTANEKIMKILVFFLIAGDCAKNKEILKSCNNRFEIIVVRDKIIFIQK